VDETGAKAFTVRHARLSDMSGVQEIFTRASMSNENDRPLFLKHPEWFEMSDDAVRERRTHVAVDQSDVVIAFASYLITDGRAELAELFVDPMHARRGVGRALVDVISERMKELNYDSLDVIANLNAVAFYERTGFEPDQLVETGGSPALRMRKRIRER
jgi:ribosomal protein S18 acetylase RimI-like enzyme